jgi:predicted ester cyclase
VQILLILYKSALELDRVKALFRERAKKYRAVRGLLQKIYVHDPATDEVGGVYVFDTPEDLDAFRSSDLEKSIAKVYELTQPATIRALEVVQELHEERPSAAADGTNAAVFRRLVEEGLSRGDLSVLEQVLAPTFEDHQDGISPPNVDGVRAFIEGARAAFPDLRLTVEAIVTAGDTTWARTTARGTHRGPFMGVPPTGKRFEIARFDTCRFEGGKIAEHWGVIDRLALLRQLGARVGAAPSAAETAHPHG